MSEIRERIVQAAKASFNASGFYDPILDIAVCAAAVAVLRVVQERLNARLMMTGAHPLADAFVEVRSLLSEIESETPTEKVECHYCRHMVAPRDPFHVHGHNECLCGEKPIHNAFLHDTEKDELGK